MSKFDDPDRRCFFIYQTGAAVINSVSYILRSTSASELSMAAIRACLKLLRTVIPAVSFVFVFLTRLRGGMLSLTGTAKRRTIVRYK